jgi:hypothetical protein
VSGDVYAVWRAACRGDGKSVEPLPTIGAPIAGENPQAGLWKVRLKKGAPPVLMQIWLTGEDGKPATEWRAGLGLAGVVVHNPERAQPQTPEEIADRWLYAEPASKDDAAHFRREGRWPADPPPLPVRSNMPTDPFEALQLEVEDRIAQAKARLKEPIDDQLACDMARNLQAEMLALGKRADAMHEAEKRPHLEAGRKVDAKYRFRDTVEEWAAKLRGAFETFLRAEETRQQAERDRLYREQLAAAEAERARIEAERRQKLADDPVAALTDPEPQLPELPRPPEPVKVRAGGGVGRRTGLKTDWEVEIVDYKLAALQVIEDPEISVLVGKLILRRVRAAKGKLDFPGITIKQVRRVA